MCLVYFSSAYDLFGECLKKGVESECRLIDMKYPKPYEGCLSVCMLHVNTSALYGTTSLGCLIQNSANSSFQGKPILLLKVLSSICVFT